MTDTLIARLRNGNLFADRVEAADRIEALQAYNDKLIEEGSNNLGLAKERDKLLRDLDTTKERLALFLHENKELRAEVESTWKLADAAEADNTRLRAELENEQRKVTAMVEGYEADQAEIKTLSTERDAARQSALGEGVRSGQIEAERDQLRAEVVRLTDLLSIVDGSVLQAAQRCMDRVKKLCDERTELQSRLTALEGQEPVAYLMTFSDGTTTIQKTAYWDSCISVDGLYLAAGAAPQQAEPVQDCCEHCDDGDGLCIFPMYGSAPHTHDTGNGWIGSTRILPKDQWGSNFREDPDCEGHGVYMRCEHCGRGEQPPQQAEPLIKKALDALEVAQDNLRPHSDNCFLLDSGEYASCFCGKDSLSNYLQDVVEELASSVAQQAEPKEQT